MNNTLLRTIFEHQRTICTMKTALLSRKCNVISQNLLFHQICTMEHDNKYYYNIKIYVHYHDERIEQSEKIKHIYLESNVQIVIPKSAILVDIRGEYNKSLLIPHGVANSTVIFL